MPRTYSDSEKKNWLAKLAQGKSIKQVAKEYKVDERTVKRSANELYSRNAAQEALTQLYQEAIRDHMNNLKAALDSIINELRLPDPHQTEIAWSDMNESGIVSNSKKDSGELRDLDDALSNSNLLTEHLRNGKAWRKFLDWKRNLEKYRIACGNLQSTIIETLYDTTGFTVYTVFNRNNTTSPFLDAEVAGALMYRCIIQHLLHEESAQLEKEVVIEEERGAIMHRGIPLISGLKNSQECIRCWNNILKSLEILKVSQEAQQLLEMFERLWKILPEVRNELRAVRLMGVVPGRCRICRQFSL